MDETKTDWHECGKRPAVQSITERGEINPGMMFTSNYVVCAKHTAKDYYNQDRNFGGYFDTYKETYELGHRCSIWGRLMVRLGKRA